MDTYDSFSDRIVDSTASQAADRIIRTSKDKGVWEVIGEIIQVWLDVNPARWQSYLIYLKDIKKTRKDKFASTKEHGRYLRYLVDVPIEVTKMIRILYPPDKLKMDKKFWRTFAKKFKVFTIPEKT